MIHEAKQTLSGGQIGRGLRRSRAGLRMAAGYAPPVLFVFILLLAWEVLVALLTIPDWLLPAPSRIAATFASDWPILRGHMLMTLWETALGFSLALAVGFALSIAIDSSSLVRKTIYPLVVASQTVPIVAVAPLLVVGFGFGLLPKVLVVALVVFFPIVINTVDGLQTADRDMLRLFRAMNANRWQTFRLLRLPAALPAVFSGLKIAVTYSIIGAVLAEWVGASSGLGVYIARSLRAFRTDRVFVAILATSLLTLGLFAITIVLERWMIPWRKEKKRG